MDNNNAKAQIFKGDGLFHLQTLIDDNTSLCIEMLINLSEEENIAGFICSHVFKNIDDYYDQLISDVVKYWEKD